MIGPANGNICRKRSEPIDIGCHFVMANGEKLSNYVI